MKTLAFEEQLTQLANETVTLVPLHEDHFELLFAVAADPLIWAQHPTPTRYQRAVFATYFAGGIESKAAFLVFDTATQTPIGSSRYYDLNLAAHSVKIGYTFLACAYWGTRHNRALKTVMLNNAFRFVDTVIFEIGAQNLRSQKAIEKLGAVRVATQKIAYFGEAANENFIYEIKKADWQSS